MKNITRPIAIAAVVLTASLSLAQTRPIGTPPPATLQDRIAPTERSPRAAGGLGDLDAMTFGCPKAALNAAARAAAAVKSEGTYQFSYFRILNSSVLIACFKASRSPICFRAIPRRTVSRI